MDPGSLGRFVKDVLNATVHLGRAGAGRVLIGGVRTCPGALGLEAKRLLEEASQATAGQQDQDRLTGEGLLEQGRDRGGTCWGRAGEAGGGWRQEPLLTSTLQGLLLSLGLPASCSLSGGSQLLREGHGESESPGDPAGTSLGGRSSLGSQESRSGAGESEEALSRGPGWAWGCLGTPTPRLRHALHPLGTEPL